MFAVSGNNIKAEIEIYSVKYKNNVDFRLCRVFNGQ